MASKQKYSRKHAAIVKEIIDKGKYKPAYSDQEPATKTLEKRGIIRWKDDYSGVVLTEQGLLVKDEILLFLNK